MGNGYTELTAESLGDGDALSQLNEELNLAVGNILDINKDPSAIRKVMLTVKIIPVKGMEREKYMVEFQASSKLPPDAAGVQPLVLSRGKGYLHEMKQLSFDEDFDPGTGEVNENNEGVTPIKASNGDAEGSK